MDPTSAHLIAAQVVAALVSLFSKATESLAPKIGEDIYAALKRRFSAEPAAEEELQNLEEKPEDESSQEQVLSRVKAALLEDEAFAASLGEILTRAGGGKAGKTISASHGGVAGENISGPIFTGDIQGSVSIGKDDG